MNVNIKIKKVNIPEGWKIHWNNFVNLEPDNSLPIDEVWTYFQEDISYFTLGRYFIDLGYYGGAYSQNRAVFFKLYVAEGDFDQGKLYECFISRSSEEIKKKIELYLELIANNMVQDLSYLKYGEKIAIGDYIFSAKEDVMKKFTASIYEEVRRSKS